MTNNKKSSKKMAEKAAKTLKDPKASKTQKKLAGSVLSQYNTDKETSKEMEELAHKVLLSEKYSEKTKSFAGSTLAQSVKNNSKKNKK